MEFDSKDPLIKKFYEDMFLGNDLNYMEFLPDQFGREYFTCITPGTPVMTDDGHKPIESVAVGDLVLTHTGRLRPVTKVTVTPVNEEVVSIRPRFGQPVTMTRDHRVLVNRGGVKSWIPAGEIRGQKRGQVADKVFVPVLDTIGVTRIDLWDHLDRASWKTFSDALNDPPNKDAGVRGNTASGIRKRMADEGYGPNDIFSAVGHKAQYAPVRHDFIVSDDFLWFLGVVVGDGCCTPDKGTTKIVFNGHEVEFAERAAKVWKEITGREAVIKSVNNEVHVMCYDTAWAHVLRDMTYRADGSRRLPSWFHRLSAHQAEVLYQGLSDSDGYTHQSGACFTQSNRLLIEDVALLVRKFEMTPRVYNLGHHSTSFAKKDQYAIRPGSHLSYTEEDELGYWVTVWKTESTHYVGDVYDLTVEDDHSFVTNGFAVHNCGEVTSLAHFNESLGVWSSEEILNPDMLRVSRSLFVQRDRVQLMVKDLVDNLRQGPTSSGSSLSPEHETPSERLQRNKEYEELQRYYPEIIEAAARNDGLDISEALISRVVNRPTPWATRGAPHLLRSFRTLMAEESLNAAQDAVADRLYSPLVLATLGIEDMGDGEPWIPDQSELDAARDDMQSALAADFRLMVHNFGLKVENVFGRESVPNLDSDYDRIERKLLQAWGIGEALISGGTGGAYASSALNREFVTQIMTGFQNSLKRHIIKRAEVIAEAQGHYDYDLKGGVRVPIYREIVEEDPETGKEYIRKVPKLIVNDPGFVKFSTLNLRDEAQERAFIAQLKGMGVPISDKTLAVNIDVEFDQELERQADESVQKLMATAQAMAKVQKLCDAQNLPYPPELAQHLMATLQLRQGKTQTELGEAQAEAGEAQAALEEEQIEMQKAILDQQLGGGAMPGQPMMSPDGAAPGAPPGGPTPPVGGDLQAPAQGPNVSPLSAPGPGAPGPGNPPAGVYANINRTNGPHGTGPAATGPSGPMGPELPPGVPEPTEIPRNRQRPAESDDLRGNAPRQARKRKRTRGGVEEPRRLSKFERGPSSYGKSLTASEEHVEAQVRRLETIANWRWDGPARHPKVSDLVMDPSFYRATNMQAYQGQLQADWPEILAGGAPDSKRILDDMLAQFYEIYGVEPEW